jgi:hypothetical protein
MVPEPVRVQVDSALPAAAGDHLVDAGGGQRLPVVHAQPQLRPPGLRVPGASPQVPVQAPGGLVADLDDPVPSALATGRDLPLSQVHVARFTTHAEKSASAARISMRELEYTLTLSLPGEKR